MIKLLLIFSFVCSFTSLMFISCEQKTNKIYLREEKDSLVSNLSNIIKDQELHTFKERYIKPYADSINLATSQKGLPIFLLDLSFDYKHKGLWSTIHDPISVRGLVFQYTVSCKSLLLILNDKSGVYKRLPKASDNIRVPEIELSIFELAKLRFEALKCE